MTHLSSDHAMLPQILLSVTFVLSACLTYVSIKSPNPSPANPYKGDRVTAFAGPFALALRRTIVLSLQLSHTFVTLTFPNPPQPICPHLSHLNPVLFTWTTYTITWLCLVICVGAPLRLIAYRGLGRNFTFQLAAPDRLITNGIYRYMQHPSYTGQAIVLAANLALFIRWDGAVGAWISPGIVESLQGWGSMVFIALGTLSVLGIVTRVRDEERMLKAKFGKEWEEWHRRTKRFIPGVF
jgi:protein-S-isoprenylcysteine O-methyltransferase Ste14